MEKLITLDMIKRNERISVLVNTANSVLATMGYTEHGKRHVGYVSKIASDILFSLEYESREVELASITGWVHDVGNAINRKYHGLNGATLLYPILVEMDMPMLEIATILAAVGNHEADTGLPVSPVSAALIIADKSDAHRTRVRGIYNEHDIHDRVNYSIKKNWIDVNCEKKVIEYRMIMDSTSSVMEFMKIFMPRMAMCEEAAKFLGCRFDIIINDNVINNHT